MSPLTSRFSVHKTHFGPLTSRTIRLAFAILSYKIFLVICYTINRKLIKLGSDFEYQSSEKKKISYSNIYVKDVYCYSQQLENTFEMLWIKLPDFISIHFS